MRKKYDKYWGEYDKLNDFMYFTVLLDPTMKAYFLEHCFTMMIMYDITKENPMSNEKIKERALGMVVDVENYMALGMVVDVENYIACLKNIKRDILAIQIFTIASELAFSTSGCILSDYRTRLSENIVEALVCTQDWVRKSRKSIVDDIDDILKDEDIAMGNKIEDA
ncbi:hypothetical protein QVD17_41728 [Tagetes erecta]|uniref:HAT C-terminal dimerisation domain-containing protein n=1 Tax=Tagetes erecta TaxID=13708 RepID=A0AAD8JL05_TARER|nr:hypothetical protein QVD17_41728 [Tagetes erecta]